MKLSVIIPAYNEQESLPQLLEEIHSICNKNSISYEVIIVDDGSTDGSFEWIESMSEKSENLHGIRFRYNCGKAAALSAGFKLCSGEYVVTMDGDLQDNPVEIPEMLEKLQNGVDMVSGWKKKRYDPWHKTLPSKFFNMTVRSMSGVKLHDFNCGFKAYKQEVVKTLHIYGELHRFIPVIAHWNGFSVEEHVVVHRSRIHGKSKYGLARLSNGFFDLVSLMFLHKYTYRPLHLFGFLGLFCSMFGFAILSWFALQWLLTGALHMRPLILGGIAAILLGFQIVSLGLLAEMLVQKSKNDYPVSLVTSHIDKRKLL
ncbi:MAG: glycosyltransferase [Fibrobacteria bacterium]|nr:glycosyltransferase [Fibrobacteria bacterium]